MYLVGGSWGFMSNTASALVHRQSLSMHLLNTRSCARSTDCRSCEIKTRLS